MIGFDLGIFLVLLAGDRRSRLYLGIADLGALDVIYLGLRFGGFLHRRQRCGIGWDQLLSAHSCRWLQRVRLQECQHR